MWNVLLVMAGGAVGSLARYGLSVGARRLWPTSEWPWGTFAANIVGGLLMGVVTAMLLGPLKGVIDGDKARLLLGVGLLGGFTTFSSFSLETVFMLERRQYGLAAGYAILSVVVSVAALAVGMMLVRKVTA